MAKQMQTEPTELCAWCNRHVPEEEPVCAVSGKAVVDLSEWQGMFLGLVLSQGKIVPAFVTTEGSQAKREGWDITMMVCSADCARELKAELGKSAIGAEIAYWST